MGITAVFFFSCFINFFNKLIEKSGLAASCIRTLSGFKYLIFFKALNDESCLFFPPLTNISSFLAYFLDKFSYFFDTTTIIFLKSFDFIALSIEC